MIRHSADSATAPGSTPEAVDHANHLSWLAVAALRSVTAAPVKREAQP